MKLEAWAVGITAGSREVPGRKGLWQETFILYNNNLLYPNNCTKQYRAPIISRISTNELEDLKRNTCLHYKCALQHAKHNLQWRSSLSKSYGSAVHARNKAPPSQRRFLTNYGLVHIQQQQVQINFLTDCNLKLRVKGKGAVIPLQARCGPEGGYRYSSTLPWPQH